MRRLHYRLRTSAREDHLRLCERKRLRLHQNFCQEELKGNQKLRWIGWFEQKGKLPVERCQRKSLR